MKTVLRRLLGKYIQDSVSQLLQVSGKLIVKALLDGLYDQQESLLALPIWDLNCWAANNVSAAKIIVTKAAHLPQHTIYGINTTKRTVLAFLADVILQERYSLASGDSNSKWVGVAVN